MSLFRRLMRKLGPAWLVKDRFDGAEVDSRAMWAVSLVMDAFAQRLRDGIQARYAGADPPEDALPYKGRDLLIIRGPDESSAAYIERLKRAVTDHKTRGSAWALLEQIRGFCSPHAIRCATVDEHGNWKIIQRDGSREELRASDWVWDDFDLEDRKTRFWVVIWATTDSPQEPFARCPEWGEPGDTWGSGRTWGSTATRGDVDGLRWIVGRWKPGGTFCQHIIYVFDDTAFDPADTAPPLPDGTWATWGKYSGTVKVPARSADAIYMRGSV